MKKKKRESKIIIHLSNRWLYFFITLGILAIVSVGVYAAQQASSGGGTHDYAEVGIPVCSNGEILKWVELPEWMGGSSWECADDDTGGSSSLWSVSGSNVYRSSGNVGIGTSNPSAKLDVYGGNVWIREISNPYLLLKDSGYATNWYIQAYQDKMAIGSSISESLVVDNDGNVGISNSLRMEGPAVTIGSSCSEWGRLRRCIDSYHHHIETVCTCYCYYSSCSYVAIN